MIVGKLKVKRHNGLKHVIHLQLTDIDEDLVKLANSLFNSEEVVNKPLVLEF